MVEHLTERLAGTGLQNGVAHLIKDNKVDLEDGSVDRILAVNLLHKVIAEGALSEMRRLLKPNGFLLIADWRYDVSRDVGPRPTMSRSVPRKALHCSKRLALAWRLGCELPLLLRFRGASPDLA